MSGSGVDLLPPRGTWVNGVDCSVPARIWRAKKLQDLRDKLYSGVDSLGDRGRSVNYVSPEELQALINKLQNEMAMCDTGHGIASRRVFTVPYSKWD